MALVDGRDIPAHESHMVQDIFKDAMLNLRNVDGFDIVDPREIRPYDQNPFVGYDEKGLPLRNEDAFDFENYWYKKFIYDFDGQAKVVKNTLKPGHNYYLGDWQLTQMEKRLFQLRDIEYIRKNMLAGRNKSFYFARFSGE